MLKALAAERTRLRADRILVAATHTHTAPPGKDRRTNRDDAAHRAYFKQLVEGIAEAIAQAEKNLVSAEMAHGVALAPEEIFNRRWHMKPGGIAVNLFGSPNDIVRMNPPRNLIDRPAGPTDPEVHFTLRARRMADRLPCWPITRCTTSAACQLVVCPPITLACSPD